MRQAEIDAIVALLRTPLGVAPGAEGAERFPRDPSSLEPSQLPHLMVYPMAVSDAPLSFRQAEVVTAYAAEVWQDGDENAMLALLDAARTAILGDRTLGGLVRSFRLVSNRIAQAESAPARRVLVMGLETVRNIG